VGHVVLAHDDDGGIAKRDPVAVGNFILFPVRHSDQKGDAFVYGRLNFISRHTGSNLCGI
jgi:hypothetical protein